MDRRRTDGLIDGLAAYCQTQGNMICELEYRFAFKQEIICFTTFFWNRMKKQEFLDLKISSFAYCRQEIHNIGRDVSGFCF